MNVHCVSYIAGVADEINSARSTPSSAPESVSGFSISPCTTSTLARSLMAVALEASRTNARTLTLLTGELPHRRLTVVSRDILVDRSELLGLTGQACHGEREIQEKVIGIPNDGFTRAESSTTSPLAAAS